MNPGVSVHDCDGSSLCFASLCFYVSSCWKGFLRHGLVASALFPTDLLPSWICVSGLCAQPRVLLPEWWLPANRGWGTRHNCKRKKNQKTSLITTCSPSVPFPNTTLVYYSFTSSLVYLIVYLCSCGNMKFSLMTSLWESYIRSFSASFPSINVSWFCCSNFKSMHLIHMSRKLSDVCFQLFSPSC